MQSTKKNELRKRCIEKMKRTAARADRYGKDKRVQRRLDALVRDIDPRTVMAYVPMATEADITPLLNRWRRRGIKVYVPFMEGESFGLVEYRYPLKRKRFGIREPKNATKKNVKSIDVAIVPVVATDKEFRRIGFGKGMYDRFFEKNAGRVAHTIFVSRTACHTSQKASDAHDVQADMVVTG